MASGPKWWLLPQVREIGRDAGAPAVREYIEQHLHFRPARSTITDRFRIEGWPLKPTSPFDRGKTARGELVARGQENEHSTDQDKRPVDRDFVSDKRAGTFSWRHANVAIRQMQNLKADASSSQDHATIRFLEHVADPICLTSLTDLHMGSFGADHDLIERISDEILNTPNFYIALLGDEEQMSLKLRNVLEVADNLLPPAMQHAYFESWLNELQHKILFSCWGNHAEMRQEAAAGFSYSAELKKQRTIYSNGIGHIDVIVGSETYRIAASHFFRGRSLFNPVHGAMRYGRHEGHDREIIMAGDSHVPGVMIYWEAGRKRVALNGGTAQTNSGYAKRFYSLTTAAIWPCVVLYPDKHLYTPYWSIAEYLAAREQGTA